MMNLSALHLLRPVRTLARSVLLTTGLGLAALATAQTGTIQIGSGSSTVDYFPIFSCYGYNYAQQIVLASEMSAASAMLGDLTAVRWFHVTQDEPATTWNHWTVYIGQTTQSSFASSTSWIPTTEMVQVYSGTITPTIGTWMELPFDAPFTWDGTSNLVVAVHEDIPSYYCTASWKGYSTPENRGLLYFNDNINPDPTAPPMANYGPSNQLAQIQFVGALASCLPPADVAISNLTAYTTDISWTDNTADSYNYEVRTSGAPGSGATGLFTSGNATSGTPAIAISGLDPNTSYTLYVNSTCGGSPSQWSMPVPFITPCVPTDIPFLEDFTNVNLYNIPACFANETLGDDTPWGTTDYPPQGMTGNCAYVYYGFSGSPADSWMHTQGINLEGGTAYRLSYKYTVGNQWDWANLSVQAESAPMASASLQQLAEHLNVMGESALSNSVDFTPPVSGVYYFGFHYFADPGQYPGPMNVDDIKVLPVPSCEEASGLAGATMSDTEGEVSWTASISNPANGYDLYYSTDPTAPDGSTVPSITGINGTSQTLSGLTTGVPVYAWVRAVCSGTDQSLWTGPVSFTPGVFQIGTGESTDDHMPIYSCYGYNYSQQIYLNSEYAGGPLLLDIAFKYTGGGDVLNTWKDWTIYMGTTSQTSFADASDWVPFTDLQEVWTGEVAPVAGEWMHITLTTPFLWDGTDNLVVAVDENTPNYSCTAEWASFDAGANRGILYFNDGTNPDPVAPPVANYGPTNQLAQIQLQGITPVDCDATPAPGATIGPVSVCPSELFTLSFENPSFDNGISNQWEVSADGVNWDPAPGVSTLSTYTTSQTADTWYRVQMTCAGNGTTPSTPVQVLTNAPTECYCDEVSFVWTVEPICNVTFAGINNTSSSAIDGSPEVEDFTNLPPANVTAGFDFPISVTGNPSFWSQPMVSVFFDWDQDGIFETYQVVGSVAGGVCTTPATATVTVPADALPGTSRMRVIKAAYTTPTDPCANYDYGQAEDYLVTVFAAVPCTEIPTPGATTGPAAVCPQAPFSVTVENVVLAEGLTYQWEISTDGTTWANAPGNSTTPAYATSIMDTTWFRAQVTCDVFGTTASTPLEVTLSPATECYCPPPIFTSVNPVCHVVLADLDNSSDAGIGATPGYEDFSNLTATVQRNHDYIFTVGGNVENWGGTMGYATAFFDWNRDGVFETLFLVGTFGGSGGTTCDSSTTDTISVPNNATYGTSRMRVIVKMDSYAMDPCESETMYNGQTEEYTIDVLNDVGMTELSGGQGIGLFPNPAHDMLHLVTPDGRPLRVKVTDLAGHTVLDLGLTHDLDISKLAVGSYLLVATANDGTAPMHARFVKQ
jgi:hypothetical protein